MFHQHRSNQSFRKILRCGEHIRALSNKTQFCKIQIFFVFLTLYTPSFSASLVHDVTRILPSPVPRALSSTTTFVIQLTDVSRYCGCGLQRVLRIMKVIFQFGNVLI